MYEYVEYVTPVVEHWLDSEYGSMDPPWRIDPTIHHTMSKMHLPQSYILLPVGMV